MGVGVGWAGRLVTGRQRLAVTPALPALRCSGAAVPPLPLLLPLPLLQHSDVLLLQHHQRRDTAAAGAAASAAAAAAAAAV